MANEKAREAARVLLAGHSPAEVMLLLQEQHQQQLHEQEEAKRHALEGWSMPAADFNALCAHLIDGGGVTADMAPSKDGKALALTVWQAIHDRDQATFWHEMPHLLKSIFAQRGLIEQIPGAPGATRVWGVEGPHFERPKFRR